MPLCFLQQALEKPVNYNFLQSNSDFQAKLLSKHVSVVEEQILSLQHIRLPSSHAIASSLVLVSLARLDKLFTSGFNTCSCSKQPAVALTMKSGCNRVKLSILGKELHKVQAQARGLVGPAGAPLLGAAGRQDPLLGMLVEKLHAAWSVCTAFWISYTGDVRLYERVALLTCRLKGTSQE